MAEKIPDERDVTPHPLPLNEKCYTAGRYDGATMDHPPQALPHPSNEDRTEERAWCPSVNSLPRLRSSFFGKSPGLMIPTRKKKEIWDIWQTGTCRLDDPIQVPENGVGKSSPCWAVQLKSKPPLECVLAICFKILTLDWFYWIKEKQLTGLSLVNTLSISGHSPKFELINTDVYRLVWGLNLGSS